MNHSRLLLASLLLLYVSSCTSCKHTGQVKCSEGVAMVQVVGFTQGDLSPLSPIIVRYKQDNAFDSVIDTQVTTSQLVANDTFFLANDTASSYQVLLKAGYDYKIILPQDTLTYAITKLALTGRAEITETYGDSGPQPCYQNIASCNINGVVTSLPLYTPDPSYATPYSILNLVK